MEEYIKNNRIFRIQRNLSDAGCDASMISQFIKLEQKHKREEQYQLLKRHKAVLLEKLHKDQYKIDCLDHMVYSMRKEDQK